MDISVRPQGKGFRCLQRTKIKCPYEIDSIQRLQKKFFWMSMNRRVSNTLSDTYSCAVTHSFTRANPLSSSRQSSSAYTFLQKEFVYKKKFTLPAPKLKLSRKSLISAPGLVPNLFSRKRSGRKVSGSSKKSGETSAHTKVKKKLSLAFNWPGSCMIPPTMCVKNQC